MDKKEELLNSWRENTFFSLLILAVGVFPFSEALVSISVGLLLFQALALRSWFHPTAKKRSRKIILLPFSVFAIYLLGTLFTKDFSFALYELKKVIFWIVVPLAVFLSPKLSERKLYTVFFVFILSVTVSGLFFTGKLILHDYFQLNGFRNISFVSHIRFSFQVALSLILLVWILISRKYAEFKISVSVIIVLILWLFYFLLLLKSLLGIVSFFGTLGFSLVFYAITIKNARWKTMLAVAFLLMVFVPSFFVGNVLNDFYDFKEVNPDTLDKQTISGNDYTHDLDDKFRENGYLLNVYMCDVELRQEWNKRSEIKYDDILNGYPLSSVLTRYLTSLGYRKDSVGVSKLTAEDIGLIEEGVTNWKFHNRFFSIYPRIYETVWELDYYLRTGDPNNKSLAQRIEFVKATLILIKESPWVGIGTGNWILKYDEVYDKMETKLIKEKRGPSHNQYLNYIMKFGILGFAWILFVLLFPVFRLGHKRNFIFILFLIFMAFANLGDANMETHMGLSFFSFFYYLFLWNSTDEMKKSILKK
ncbi:hypothetical protein D1164_18550 [Mariniphaga sediminis]|uniref:O-antigen ligase-related domain-containing protein n=1 Tax=Mariniphaga sediminis TaxID=1628158 RepID=A0A399CX99_9BACT|nr:O-antigen ligase family protein [Mariniphaga sediminis]RIH63588.1 hypothetical protein D1164_18550 [Mariniphaga sediminis]